MYVLLVANVIFYLAAGFDQFLVLLLATAVSYVVACKMGKLHEKLEKQKQEEGLDRKQIKRMKANNKKQRKRILIWGLVLNIGILVVFKYTNFLLKTGYSILDLFGIGHGDDLFKLIMPLGISFFTFQILSYLIDVYKGKVKAQKNFLKYLLYISFFPSVVQGPIPRYADLGTQLYEEHRFEYDNLRDGALLILWGFAKKLILAERLGTFVDQIYGNYTQYTGMLFFFVATAAFSIQIYADFSGCMDIATGTARLFGIRLAPNFLRPYFSKTMPEFWRRWHISLSSFFRDYLYIPLGGSRVTKPRWVFNIAVVWAVTGLWHGAAWNFVLWGVYYGALLICEKLFLGKLIEKLPRILQHVYMLAVVIFGWTFFWIPDVGQLVLWWQAMLGSFGACGTQTFWQLTAWEYWPVFLICAVASVPICPYVKARFEAWVEGRKLEDFSKTGIVNTRCIKADSLCMLEATPINRQRHTAMLVFSIAVDLCLLALLVLSILSIVSGSYNPFIYFQF